MKLKRFLTILIITITIFTIPIAATASGGSGGDDNENEKESVCGVIQEITPTQFNSEVTYNSLKSAFATKFPIDMIAINPINSSGEEDCPVFHLMGRNIPACSINMLIRMMKWPLIIRYIIWSVFAL